MSPLITTIFLLPPISRPSSFCFNMLLLVLAANGLASRPATLIANNNANSIPWWQQRLNDIKLKTTPDAQDPEWARASLLMQKRSLADCEKAVELYELALARTDGDPDPRLCLEAAQARNAVMRIKTHSNTLHITRMLDTPESKKIWRRHGPRAVELAERAKKELDPDPEALVAYADAYFFANSVKGVLAAATTGSGLKFKGNSKELIKRCEKAESGLGHAYLGAFFLMAPWPLSSAKKAEEHLLSAHRIAPCRRNAYYLGVMHYRLGRPSKAADYFREAIQGKAFTPSEGDFSEWVLDEAKKALAICEEQQR
jgi:tetratricopeptide (TPR) repeat protein